MKPRGQLRLDRRGQVFGPQTEESTDGACKTRLPETYVSSASKSPSYVDLDFRGFSGSAYGSGMWFA